MHLRPAIKVLILVIVGIGLSAVPLKGFAYENGELSAEKKGLVEVEPTFIQLRSDTKDVWLEPYRKRRKKWGNSYAVVVSQFHPVNHEPNFLTLSFDELYGEGSFNLVEFQYVAKRNYSFAAVGMELALGFYSKESLDPDPGYTLRLQPLRIGAKLSFDTVWEEPFVVPYVAAGGYVVFFGEEDATRAFKGVTQIAPYGSLGLAFQLDWLDPANAFTSFRDNRIQNTFIFVEGRTFMASSAVQDPDFSTDIHLNLGIDLEY